MEWSAHGRQLESDHYGAPDVGNPDPAKGAAAQTASVTVQNKGNLSAGSLTLNNGATLAVSGGSQVSINAAKGAQTSNIIVNQGSITVSGASQLSTSNGLGLYQGAVTLSGKGTTASANTLAVLGTNNGAAKLVVESGATLTTTSSTRFTQIGGINGEIDINADASWTSSGTISVGTAPANGQQIGKGVLSVSGTLTTAGGSFIYKNGVATIDGTWSMSGGTSPGLFNLGGTLGGKGTVNGSIRNGQPAEQGSIEGTLDVKGYVDSSNGAVKPGRTAAGPGLGTLTIDGNADLGGELAIDVFPGQGCDLLAVNGTATLTGGTLDVDMPAGYTPPLGTQFVLLTASGSTENTTFSSAPIDGTPVDGLPGYVWHVDYSNPDAVILDIQTSTAHIAVTAFQGDSSNNDLDLSYQILPPAGGWPANDGPVTIPSFSVNVFADPTGSLDGMSSGNQIASYPVSDPACLTGTADNNQFTLNLPADQITNLPALESAGKHYLLAGLDFTDGTSIAARFQGGAFQTNDGVTWFFGGASLDQQTPESHLYTDNVTVTSADGSVTASGSISGGDTNIQFSQNFSLACQTVEVFTYNNTSTIDGSGIDAYTSIYALGGNGNNTFDGGQGNDSLIAGNGTNTLSDLGGNDFLKAGGGNNTLTAGSGNDSLTVGNGTNTITATNGTDTVDAGNGNDTVTLGWGNDTIQAGGGNNVISALYGNDSVTLGSGNNTVTLTDGNNDGVAVGNGNNKITVGNGNNDMVTVGDGINTITAANGVDTVSLGTGNNTVTLGWGNDNIYVRDVNGNGNNVINALNGNDSVTLGSGNNSVTLTDGTDNIDSVTVGNGNNTISAGDGQDTLTLGGGNNNVNLVRERTTWWLEAATTWSRRRATAKTRSPSAAGIMRLPVATASIP